MLSRRLLLLVPPLALLVALLALAPVGVLLTAPWLVVAFWRLARHDLGDPGAIPSSGERARRRLAVR